MKRILVLIFFILILIQSMNAQTDIKNIEGQILEVKNTFAPDKRTAIFDIHIAEVAGKFVLSGETNLPGAKEYLLKKMVELQIKDEIKLLPGDNLGEKTFGIVNISVANLRAKPEHSAELATQATLGTIVKLYKKTDDGWYFVQTPDDYISWVDGEAIQWVSKVEAESWKRSEKIIFTTNYGSAFEKSDENNGVISDLVFGNLLKLISSGNNYYQVEFPDGREAFIRQSEAGLFSEWLKNRSCTPEGIISTAKKFMGIPYLWGGTSAKGLDCSGFTKTVLFANGIVMPRDASQQVSVGETINTDQDFSNLQPGDLLFFGFPGDHHRKERITHVAIYLGENDFIHSSGRVMINSFDKAKNNFSNHRLTTFRRAKRIVTSLNQNGVKSIDSSPFYK
ncbi:MAG: glycoside hydrolase [Ignavibacteria bacterium CG_4_8_14_3_um_filter_37_9]|nr:C40 family peptidase [Ignavibacteria bacterium]OIO14251.1 MAG: glycoside hydrolase [Ignavibacteria bacterium CG1_02_37_35]PIP77523.1 MAG: glycoside hydrolase [Ignavibacteria bacterium CG22_combo_CG10-13_8_21_14_all_37_15]PIS44407.1 MAG: glycoside hydrolase [Ignavibacteria bacterium CG08_land_8_20_14_0_20_37_9]PIW98125.1 MAG: glycoside hydrolase [Ignavibacteria bacterium CG_4_8_14_3_um_filter_37_9]PJC57558.1 MAG: glycoside hydrolase [Ignavibacteria bacterium CG_4_9_14_0_2_um_filter_37_13]